MTCKRRRRTRRCCRPRCRASGRTTSGCRRSRRAQWLASSKSPSCCATSTSPVSSAAARTKHTNRWLDANRTACSYAQYIHSVYTYLQKADTHTHTHMHPLQSVCYHSLNPESWTCLLVREYANQLIKKKKERKK